MPKGLHRLDIAFAPFARVGVGRVFHLEKARGRTTAAQEIHHQPRELRIIRTHEGHIHVLKVAIEQHRRDILEKAGHRVPVRGPPQRCHQHTRRFQRAQRLKDLDLVGRIAMGRIHRRAVSGLDAKLLKLAGKLGKNRVCEERHDDSHILGQLAVLVHREHVRAVIMRLKGGLNALAGRRAHALGVVEILRDRGSRDAANCSKLFHVLDFRPSHLSS